MRQTPFVSLCLATGVLLLAGCRDEPKPPEAPRPVRTTQVQAANSGETLTATGEIRARYEADIGFRIDGKILERPVDVGSTVKKGDLLARVDPQPQKNALAAAQSELNSAKAETSRAAAAEAREGKLLKDGFTTQARYEVAERDLKAAQAKVAEAEAHLQQARDNLAYTELRADADGVISAVGAEAGQVVPAGKMVVRLAQPGEREASFDIAEAALKGKPQDGSIEVWLASDEKIRANGSLRYLSPQADPQTRTFNARVSLPQAPPQMRLGATVVGRVTVQGPTGHIIPNTALFQKGNEPAVWVLQPDSTVQLRAIKLGRYDAGGVLVTDGLKDGEAVVTAGVNTLMPGQKVRAPAPVSAAEPKQP